MKIKKLSGADFLGDQIGHMGRAPQLPSPRLDRGMFPRCPESDHKQPSLGAQLGTGPAWLASPSFRPSRPSTANSMDLCSSEQEFKKGIVKTGRGGQMKRKDIFQPWLMQGHLTRLPHTHLCPRNTANDNLNCYFNIGITVENLL